MDVAVTFNKQLLTEDLRSSFEHFIQREMAAQGVDQSVKTLYNTEPQQLSFKFSSRKTIETP